MNRYGTAGNRLCSVVTITLVSEKREDPLNGREGHNVERESDEGEIFKKKNRFKCAFGYRTLCSTMCLCMYSLVCILVCDLTMV